MSLREAPKLQTPSIRLLRASSTGTPYIIPNQPAASSPAPAASIPPTMSPSAASSASTSASVPSFSTARPATLRSRFSPAHIRINTQSRHAPRDSSDRIKEEEEGKEERISSELYPKPPPQRQPQQPQQLPARSALQLSHARPSIHTTSSRDVKLRSAAVMLSASPAVTPSSSSPRSSFLPTTRLHSHSLSNFSSPHARLSQHPEDGAGGHSFFSPSSSASRRNSLSRYNPIGNEEARGGRDADDVAVSSSLPSSLPNVPSSLSSSAAAARDRPTSQGSWRHRRPQSLTAPFSSNAIAATTTTATALSAQLQSAHSVSPSVQNVAFTSASSSSSTPLTTSSPPSSSSMSSSYRNASPLVSSLSPSLISSLMGESLHAVAVPLPHVHEEEAETVNPPVLVLEVSKKGKRMRAKDRREGRDAADRDERKDGREWEEKERPPVLQRVVHHKSSRASGAASVPAAPVSASSTPAPSPPLAPSPRVSSHATSAQSSPPAGSSPLLPVSSPAFGLASFPSLSSSASPPPGSLLSSSPLSFSPMFPVDDSHPHLTVRIARRSRVTGGLVLMSPQETLQAWEAGEGGRGRGSSLPSSHWRDFSALSAINAITQHAAAQAQAQQAANVALPVSNQG
jgi:hypothetical protein